MNVNDTEIAWSILKQSGTKGLAQPEADVILLVTCSVRLHGRRAKRGDSAEGKACDIVAGPDAYRDLPRLLAVAETGQQAANVLLLLDETYADIIPVHHVGKQQVCLCVTRSCGGCDNMCTYCIVPFTRGHERSRPLRSLVESPHLSRGFHTIYEKGKGGLRFVDLLDQVLQLISGVTTFATNSHPRTDVEVTVLKAMQRGYSREAYLELIHTFVNLFQSFAGVSLSSDFIAGFCQETEADHMETISLLRETHHRLQDDVPLEVKKQRLEELITVFREEARRVNQTAVGSRQLVLVEGSQQRFSSRTCGRNDGTP
ncbi:hypothetical protein GDO86_013993, partial [Hymenochirus boettgeri]